jgi:zinc protease
MNAVLGGLFGSRINLNLREAHGYTYGASSFYDWRRGPGPFVVSTAVQSEVTAPALREILLEIDRIRGDRISEDELLLARDYLEGVFPIRYETTAAIASALATLVIYDLPADYFESYRKNIRAVSAEAVLQAARSHLHPDELQTIVVGDARLIRGPISDLNVGDPHVHSP